jgi:glycosyltransferase involved in cell wall biosynthesis
MLSIVLADDTRSYDGRSLETEPLGGTESSVIRFARALAQRGHEVTCFTNCAAPIEHEGVRWVPLSHPKPERCDVYIPVQHVRLFGLVRRPKRRVVWVLWQPNEYKHYKKLPLFWAYRPIPLLMSHHQRRIYSPLLPRRSPHVIIPLGLPDDIRGLPPLDEPPPPQAIFASNPQRNLAPLVRIWAERIFPRRPDAILNVYGLHGIAAGEDAWQRWAGSLLPAGIPEAAQRSVRIHPTAPREQLMTAIRRSRAMLYLGHKVEAFCLTVAEAQAMGVPCVVAPETVLPERVIDGVTGCVRGDPQAFADAALDLFNDDALWRRQHEAALRLQQGISWAEYAYRFEAALLSDMLPAHAIAPPSGPQAR